ncbi:hypothetical protein NDU88_001329 [Pleurodeles waltl]|uniref:Uncharacterized protein n=1 Tax=Pleurodeles waltl TaxID=8319 RepID=A0AAV7R6S2_PLEWA|nr:hypothetical protein NDU88_001329 [Pleurodeles waltl]
MAPERMAAAPKRKRLSNHVYAGKACLPDRRVTIKIEGARLVVAETYRNHYTACSDTATFTTEATRKDGNLIGHLPPRRDRTVVKTRLPPFPEKKAVSWSWSTPELTNDKEWTDQEDADRGDTEPLFWTSGTTLEFGAEESRCENEDRWPRGAYD